MFFASQSCPKATPRADRIVWLPIAISATLLGLWLWSTACRFPSIPWNDERLAPTIALARGCSIYPTATEGTINTWTYGPLPVLLFLPAALATSSSTALEIAATMNILVALVPLVFVCVALAAPDRARTAGTRVLAILACAALWPEWQYLYHVADNLAVAFGLIASVVVYRWQTQGLLCIAALLAACAVGCKQTAIGIPMAHLLWLVISSGWRTGARYGFWCLTFGLALAAVSAGIFGGAGLWFAMISLPGSFAWTSLPLARLREMAPHLTLHVIMPALVMLYWRHIFSRGWLLLAALAWCCTLPLGLAALLKSGGRMNSVHSFLLWMPMVVAHIAATTTNRAIIPAIGFATVLIACARVSLSPALRLTPQLAFYKQGEMLASAMKGRVWFPLHPLITLFSDGRYYHDEDGLYVRALTRQPITQAQLWAHLPPAMSVVALPDNLTTWGIARQVLPANAVAEHTGAWTLWHLSNVATQQ